MERDFTVSFLTITKSYMEFDNLSHACRSYRISVNRLRFPQRRPTSTKIVILSYPTSVGAWRRKENYCCFFFFLLPVFIKVMIASGRSEHLGERQIEAREASDPALGCDPDV